MGETSGGPFPGKSKSKNHPNYHSLFETLDFQGIWSRKRTISDLHEFNTAFTKKTQEEATHLPRLLKNNIYIFQGSSWTSSHIITIINIFNPHLSPQLVDQFCIYYQCLLFIETAKDAINHLTVDVQWFTSPKTNGQVYLGFVSGKLAELYWFYDILWLDGASWELELGRKLGLYKTASLNTWKKTPRLCLISNCMNFRKPVIQVNCQPTSLQIPVSMAAKFRSVSPAIGSGILRYFEEGKFQRHSELSGFFCQEYYF